MADTKISALTAATTPLAGTEVLPIVQSGSTVKVANNDLRPKQIQSNATSGVLQVAGPAASTTRVMTVPDANFTAARTDAAQTFLGVQTIDGTTSAALLQVKSSSLSSATGQITNDTTNNIGLIFNTTAYPISVRVANTERFQFDTSGNLVPKAAAKGINFTANTPAAGMTSQLLNWYEEGTWTPTLTTSGTNFTSVTYDPATGGRYIRIGRVVHVQMYLRTDAVTVGSASGDVLIGGLPFTSVANSGAMVDGNSSLAVSRVSDWTTDQPNAARVNGNSTLIELYKRATSNGASANVAIANVGTGANLNTIYIAGTYIAA